jgi:hypothetical protein
MTVLALIALFAIADWIRSENQGSCANAFFDGRTYRHVRGGLVATREVVGKDRDLRSRSAGGYLYYFLHRLLTDPVASGDHFGGHIHAHYCATIEENVITHSPDHTVHSDSSRLPHRRGSLFYSFL